MIQIKTEAYPKKGLKAVCSDCGFVMCEMEWNTYPDYKSKKAKLIKKYSFCQKCGAVNKTCAPTWRKESNGDWSAKCKNGDFIIWRYGSAYKWRYRRYGGVYADQIGFAKTLAQAKRACENHEEWIKALNEKGYKALFCYGAEEAKRETLKYLEER